MILERVIQIDGVDCHIISDDEYLRDMGRVFEPHMVELFKSLLSPEDVVVDIGANIGMTSLLFATLCNKVYAFEPSPSTFGFLTENLASNGVFNVKAFMVGLGSETKELKITFDQKNRSGAFIGNTKLPEENFVTEEVCIETLDDFRAVHQFKPSFIKIDVEGFEMEVIKGAITTLSKLRPTVVMEMNHFCLNVLHRIALPDFLDFMRDKFPYLFAVDADNSTIVDLHNSERSFVAMYQHVVLGRFPNIIGFFSKDILGKLDSLVAGSSKQISERELSSVPLLNPRGKIELLTDIGSLRCADELKLNIKLTNLGDEEWVCRGKNPVYLSYHWYTLNGEICIFDGLRSTIAQPTVSSSDCVAQSMSVVAPELAGRYRLVLTLVQEGISWFEERGFYTTDSCVTVK